MSSNGPEEEDKDRGGDLVQVSVENETWRELNIRRENPGDTFDDVIKDLIETVDD